MKSHVKIIALILLIGYTMLLTYWMIWGFGRTTQPEISYNLVPFTTMASYFPIRSFELIDQYRWKYRCICTLWSAHSDCISNSIS